MPITKETTVQDLWELFEERIIPPEATDAQRGAMRDAFFLGAHGLYTVIAAYQREVAETKPSTAELYAMAGSFANHLTAGFRAYFAEKNDDGDNDQKH